MNSIVQDMVNLRKNFGRSSCRGFLDIRGYVKDFDFKRYFVPFEDPEILYDFFNRFYNFELLLRFIGFGYCYTT